MIAAWIDTEGCITAQRGKKNAFYLAIRITQKDPRPLRWIQRRTNGSLQYKRDRRLYVLSISSRQATTVLENTLPYFLSKREQVELGIELGNKPIPIQRQAEISGELKRLKRTTYV